MEIKDREIIYAVIFSTLTILLLIAGIIIVIALANKRRALQSLLLVETKISYEKELRTAQQEIQEQILNHVSSELHDNIGQLLTFMHLQMETGKLKNPTMEVAFKGLGTTLDDTIQQVRLLSHSLNIDLLERNGLLVTMNTEVNRLSQLEQLKIHFTHDEQEPELQPDQKLMAFRIFQELCNNALKHAAAKNISIRLTGKEKFVLTITDDGKGYDTEAMMAGSRGAGLRNIVKRAQLADLSCEIKSSLGTGSSCTIRNN